MNLGVLILLWLLGGLIFWGGLSWALYRYHPRWYKDESMVIAAWITIVVLAIAAVVTAAWNYRI